MSLESAVAENTKALNLVAGLLQEFIKGAGSPKFDARPAPTDGAVTRVAKPVIDVTTLATQKSAPPAAAPPEETVSAAAPSAEPSVPAQADAELTPQEIRQQLAKLVPELVKAKKKEQAVAVLKEFGATSVPQVKDGDLPALLAKLKAL